MSDTSISALRLSPGDERDLSWLFNDAECAMGMRSNMGAQLDLVRTNPGRNSGTKGVWRGGGDGNENGEDRRIEAAERFRRVSARLGLVPMPKQRVLQAYYGVGTMLTGPQQERLAGKERRAKDPKVMLSTYGLLVGIVVLLSDRQRGSRRSLVEDVETSGQRGDEGHEAKARVGKRKQEAELALVEACAAYREACRAVALRERQLHHAAMLKHGVPQPAADCLR